VNKPGWRPVIFRPKEGSYYQYANSAALHTDPHLEVDMIFTLSPKPHQTKIHTQRLGNAYNPPSGHSHGSVFTTSFLARSSHSKPDEVEVFYKTGYK